MSITLQPDTIILIGMMGAGKTTIGRALAQCLQREFVDLDHEIVRRCGVTIPTIFDIEGEEGFRCRETQTLKDVIQTPNIVLATGGGAVLNSDNRLLLQTGTIIYLQASAQDLYERIAYDRNRPLMQTDHPQQTLQNLLTQRHPIYSELANICVTTGKEPIPLIVQRILEQLQDYYARS